MITTKRVEKTPPDAIPVVGNRVLHVLDVDGVEVWVYVEAKGLGYAMEVTGVDDVDLAARIMGHVATDPMGRNS